MLRGIIVFIITTNVALAITYTLSVIVDIFKILNVGKDQAFRLRKQAVQWRLKFWLPRCLMLSFLGAFIAIFRYVDYITGKVK